MGRTERAARPSFRAENLTTVVRCSRAAAVQDGWLRAANLGFCLVFVFILIFIFIFFCLFSSSPACFLRRVYV